MTDHRAAEICPKAAQGKKSEDGSGGKTRGGRRKRKGSFTVPSHAVAQTRSESRVGRDRAGARVTKKKCHCFGCYHPAVTACGPWELSWHNLNRVWSRGGILMLTFQRGCKIEVMKTVKGGTGPLNYVSSPQLEFGLSAECAGSVVSTV